MGGSSGSTGPGLYALAARDASEQETILEAAKAVLQGVICLLSALRLHGLTTQNPHEVWIAVHPDQWKPTRTYPQLRIVRMSGAAMTVGVEGRVVDTIRVRAFSPAKTVVDCFRYHNKIGLDVALEALREGWRTKAVSMYELTAFAKRLRMERVLRPYLESLVRCDHHRDPHLAQAPPRTSEPSFRCLVSPEWAGYRPMLGSYQTFYELQCFLTPSGELF